MEPSDITAEMERARADFHHLIDNATTAELRGDSNGTKWSNEQLLFHMLFGFLLVHNLLPLVKVMATLPRQVSRGFAAILNAGTKPFHVINYVGSIGGGRVLGPYGMERLMDLVVGRLQRFVTNANVDALSRGMHFPTGWDPYFSDYMTLCEIYHYPTQHYHHHRRQLTLAGMNADEP